ncbi:hypothetical protein CRENPOLYSF1_270050 [Crenothrix polyspora]|uniref:Uncharacterized protein n=1 Tax=Crenothrix polyspora TaxID=360316 RepID=A0A1R4H8E4_9GAMM|nr:hypothetical protein CRENPOLYSF1_270050 [Crenothrix polyspora]
MVAFKLFKLFHARSLGQLQPPLVLSLSKHEWHTSTSSVRNGYAVTIEL